jgi:hypothetical protein
MGVHASGERGFDLTLAFGQEAEDDVAAMFDGIAGGVIKIEVKRDARCVETGRLFVEYQCRGRDGVWRKSGIATSTADYWVYVIGDTGVRYLFPTEQLLYLARRAYKDAKRRVLHPYGENPTRGVLIDLSDLVRHALELPFRKAS